MALPVDYQVFTGVQVLWIIIAIVWAHRRGDETPLLISAFLFYVMGFRFLGILKQWTLPVDISQFGFQPLTYPAAIDAFRDAVIGETALLMSYMLAQRRAIKRDIHGRGNIADHLRARVLLLAAICIPTSLVARQITSSEVQAGRVLAFESSAYIYLFPFCLVSIGILLAVVWKAGGFQTPAKKCLALALFGVIAIATFGPTGRFQFLGWLLAATIIFASGLRTSRKTFILVSGVVITASLFAIAGALRDENTEQEELGQNAWERFVYADDANMLDGFVLLREVYPALLPFDYGRGHVEIFTRPIPRAWWPDKPVGGYMNKLGLNSVLTGGTLGISPSLFGSLYQEGGIFAMAFLAAVYGIAIGRFVAFTTSNDPIAGTLLRAMLCAFLIPLLRGGDLPGIVAWAGMAFWPCMLLLFWTRHEFSSRSSLKTPTVTAVSRMPSHVLQKLPSDSNTVLE